MIEPSPGKSRLLPANWRWRELGRRRRVLPTFLAGIVLCVAGWFLLGPHRWSARAVLRSEGYTWPLAYSPDGARIASSGTGGITIWDIETGLPRTAWKTQGRNVLAGAFSPDGRMFAAIGSAGHPQPLTIDLIEVDTGRIASSLPTSSTGVLTLAFSPDSRSLRVVLGEAGAGSKLQGETVVFEVATGQVASSHTFASPVSVGPMAVSSDGRLAAFASFGARPVLLWDLNTDRPHAHLGGSVQGPAVSSVGFSPDGSLLGVGREDGSIELWDIQTLGLTTTIRGHSEGYKSIGLQFAPDGLTLASRGDGRPNSAFAQINAAVRRFLPGRQRRPEPEVIILDVSTGRRLRQAFGADHPYYSPDSRIIATRYPDLSVRLFDVPDAQER